MLPKLPASTVTIEAAPRSQAKPQALPTIAFPDSGTWSLRLDYAATQRAAGLPDLDIHARAQATLTAIDGKLKVSKAEFNVRPAGETIETKVEAALIDVVSKLKPLSWSPASATDAGTVVVHTPDKTWAILDTNGVVSLQLIQEVSRNDPLQRSRLVLSLVR